MNDFSKEYIGSLAIVVISLLKAFGVEIESDVVTGIITGGIALYVAYRRFKRGDITLGGTRKY